MQLSAIFNLKKLEIAANPLTANFPALLDNLHYNYPWQIHHAENNRTAKVH